MPLASLLRLFRPPSAAEIEAVRAYREQVAPIASRLSVIRDDWLDLSRTSSDAERLANAASVYRWEVLRLRERLAAVPAPAIATSQGRDLLQALADAARASQLLATGHRFHKSETICDGQILLVESVAAIEAIARGLDDLARTGS